MYFVFVSIISVNLIHSFTPTQRAGTSHNEFFNNYVNFTSDIILKYQLMIFWFPLKFVPNNILEIGNKMF